MDWRSRDNGTEPDLSEAEALRAALGCSAAFAKMLLRRGVHTAEDAAAYLHPEQGELPKPTYLFELERAAKRIEKAIAAGERICVYGDYDVDGISATVILCRALQKRGADVSYYIPMRAGEGYGMHAGSVELLAKKGIRLLVTVDNGISAHEEVALARSLGMDVIVTDHHRCHEELPNASAVVCATRPGQRDGIANLCGAAVAMLLAIQLGFAEEDFLAIAALATVADVMPLTGYNRVIVARGMRLIRTEPGLCALLEAAGAGERELDASTLGFVLAPRINAAGRMGDARRAAELLLTEDAEKRQRYAAELEAANAARKAEETRIQNDAVRQVDPTVNHVFLMLRGEDWNPGVIGIVAARLVEQYGCPVLLFTREGDELVGSGRSVPGVDLFALLTRHGSFFTRFGGHTGAAGAAMHAFLFDQCRKEILKDLTERFPQGLTREPIVYEDALSLSDCTVQLCDEIASLAPFGEENREPVFRLSGLLSDVAPMGRDGAHLSLNLSAPEGRLRLAAFRFGSRRNDWAALKKADVLCTLHKNVFRGSSSVNGHVVDLHAQCPEKVVAAAKALLREDSGGARLRVTLVSAARPTTQEMRNLFIRLRGRLQTGLRIEELYEPELITMLILHEAEIVDAADDAFWERMTTGKKDITKGRLYSLLYL